MTAIDYARLYIGGGWVTPATGDRIEVVSASTERPAGSVPAARRDDVDRAVAAARRAFDDPAGWASWEPARRAEVMDALADELEARAEEMARRVSTQNGMPITLSRRLEADFPITVIRYYAALARLALADEHRPGLLGGSTIVRRAPVGVVGVIVPWSYPQTPILTKLAPALAAGCTVVIKPSPRTVLDGFLLAEAIDAAGVPDGVVNIVPGHRDAGAYLVAHPGVDKIAFTGSPAAGRDIAATCGRLLRPVALELGGRSTAIVLDDADVAARHPDLVAACLVNNGQTGNLGAHVLAPAARYDEIVERITGHVAALPVGDALDPETVVGPLVSARQRHRVESYVARGVADGARLTTGGRRPGRLRRGWFVEPTVLADVGDHAAIAHREIFGPVLAITPYRDDADAVRLAARPGHGPGGSVWTGDVERGLAVARAAQTARSGARGGKIGVNGHLPEPDAPFGGFDDGGLGRAFTPEVLAGYTRSQAVGLPAGPPPRRRPARRPGVQLILLDGQS